MKRRSILPAVLVVGVPLAIEACDPVPPDPPGDAALPVDGTLPFPVPDADAPLDAIADPTLDAAIPP